MTQPARPLAGAIGALAAVATAWICAVRGPVSAQPAAAQPATDEAARGQRVYQKYCRECHGQQGHGDGPGASWVSPRPRDFTAGRYKIRSTETGSVPTDDDLLRSVRQGLYGSAMPAWDRLLPDGDIADVVAYVKTLSPRFSTDAPVPVVVGEPVPSSPESVSRGEQVYVRLQCGKCHGTDGRGTGAVTTDFEDDWKQPLRAADLTQPWTFHGGATARDVYLRFRTGMSGTPMPSFRDTASDAEMWDLANYVVSLGRKPVWSMTAEEISSQYAAEAAEAKANPVGRGRYLVDTHLCALCHSPIDAQGRMLPGLRLAGGQMVKVVPYGSFPAGNLTSDRDTGIGAWSDDELKRAITQGIRRDGSRMLPFPMDWPGFAALTPDDLNAMIAYLRSVPPVYNKIPTRSRPLLPLYLWGKFKMLILQQDPPIIFYPGNAGDRGGRS